MPLCILRLCVVIVVLYSNDQYCKNLKTSKWWWLSECDDNTKFLCGHLNVMLLLMDWAFKSELWLFTSCHFLRLLAHALVNQRMEMQTSVTSKQNDSNRSFHFPMCEWQVQIKYKGWQKTFMWESCYCRIQNASTCHKSLDICTLWFKMCVSEMWCGCVNRIELAEGGIL